MSERTILVIDDDDAQLETLCRGLFHLGLECVTARTRAEAMAQLSGPAGARVTLLLVDLSAPGKPGAGLTERARSVRSDLQVLVVTGLAPSSEVSALAARGTPILRKPFTPEQLGRAIQLALLTHEPKGNSQ